MDWWIFTNCLDWWIFGLMMWIGGLWLVDVHKLKDLNLFMPVALSGKTENRKYHTSYVLCAKIKIYSQLRTSLLYNLIRGASITNGGVRTSM